MLKRWDEEGIKEGIAELLYKGAVPSLPPCEKLVEGFPDELIPPSNGSINSGDVLKAVLERIFAATNEPHVRAAREYIGWTERSYEEICEAARVELGTRPPSSEASDEEKERYKQERLKLVTVRQYLAGLEIQLGGLRARTVKDTHKDDIADRLYLAFRDFIRDPRQVQTVAADLKLRAPVPGVTMTTDEVQDQGAVPERPARDADYVHRDEIEREFQTLVEQGAKLIAFVGFPGMGKTSIVKALTRGSPFIECVDGKPRVTHLQQALGRYVGSTHLVQAGDEPALLGLLANQESGPPFVVLDNLQSTAELRMIPPDTAVTIVATCRETGLDVPSWCEEIRVGAMKEEEAIQLAERKHGSLDRADAQFVANQLDRYPLLISVACRLASVTGLSIRTLCRELQLDPGNVPTRADETLRRVTVRAVSFIRTADGVAIDLLACISYGDLLTVEHLHQLVKSRYGENGAGVRCAKAISLLQDLALIEAVNLRLDFALASGEESPVGADDESVSSGSFFAQIAGIKLRKDGTVTFLSMHRLVGMLLRDSLKEDALRITDYVSTQLMELLAPHDATLRLNRLKAPDSPFFTLVDINRGFRDVASETAREFWQMYADKSSKSREILNAEVSEGKLDPEYQELTVMIIEVLMGIADADNARRTFLEGFMSSLEERITNEER